MKDTDCVAFLQWCLPRLDMRWPGFRKVRRQVCKRIGRRLGVLRLDDVAAYRVYLDTHPEEWRVLDGLCRVTISRFFRDRGMFEALGGRILPTLTTLAAGRGDDRLNCWSVGCASGEEPYSLAILWHRRVRPRIQGPPISILGTDADAAVLRRAATGCYAPGTLKELLEEELTACFERRNRHYFLREAIRDPIRFREQDVRTDMPDGPFHLILCRNLVFTYFSETRQNEILRRLVARLVPGGCLVIGRHERLPPGADGLEAETGRNDMFWKRHALRRGRGQGRTARHHRHAAGQGLEAYPFQPVSIGSDSSLPHSDMEPSYTATFANPSKVSAKASLEALTPPPQQVMIRSASPAPARPKNRYRSRTNPASRRRICTLTSPCSSTRHGAKKRTSTQ